MGVFWASGLPVCLRNLMVCSFVNLSVEDGGGFHNMLSLGVGNGLKSLFLA